MFWLAFLLLLIVYPYVIYPALLWLIRGCFAGAENEQPAVERQELPLVTFIVVFFNESSRLPEKIANTLALDYPAQRIEYLFVSDGSDDASDELVSANPGFGLRKIDGRVGKEQALTTAIAQATGEILVMSDVGTLLAPDAIHRFVGHFADPRCGAVSSYDRIEERRLTLEGAFIRLEMLIRECEARMSSCVGVSGSLFATRRELALELQPDQCSDLGIAFVCQRRGYRATIDPAISGVYRKAHTATIELSRKQRTIVHGVNTVIDNLDLLNPLRHGWFSWQLLSHKLMRWISPVACTALVLVLLTELMMELLVLEGIAWTFVTAGCLVVAGRLLLRLPALDSLKFAVASSFAVYSAIWDLLRGRRHVVWSPTRRS